MLFVKTKSIAIIVWSFLTARCSTGPIVTFEHKYNITIGKYKRKSGSFTVEVAARDLIKTISNWS